MRVRLAIAKRRSKQLAAGVVFYIRNFRAWQLTYYSVVDEQACFFSASFFASAEEAMAAGSQKMQVREEDWIKVDQADVEGYIVEHAGNKWIPIK